MSSFLASLTIGSILLGAALLLIVALFLARPFAMPEDEEKRVDREEIDGLLLRKESLLRDIRELDDDYESAKVAPELYMRTRPQMVRQAAVLMKQLDEHGYVAPDVVSDADTDARIEAAVRRLRTPQQLDDEMEAAIRRARAGTGDLVAATTVVATTVVATTVVASAASNGGPRYCPQCGRRVESDERFCPQCGRNLVQEHKPSQAAGA